MARDEQPLSEDLREMAERAVDERMSKPLHLAADRAEAQERLLAAMHEFIESEYRAEFEETLDYDTQELYREQFGLSQRLRGEFDDLDEDDEIGWDRDEEDDSVR